MLALTEAAARLLTEVLERDEAIRIVEGAGGWTMHLDHEAPEDERFEHEGRTIILLAPSVAEALEDKTLDVHNTGQGWKLRLE
jgi:dethiobiotin synthetase